jgi:UMF1 family MFS transporter
MECSWELCKVFRESFTLKCFLKEGILLITKNFREAEFFSLYALTDKGASWIGPLVVGAITDSTHEIRYSFFFLLASMILALFIISTVNPEKGRNEAADLSRLTSD